MNLQQTDHTRVAQVSLNNPHHDVAFPIRIRLQLASIPARANAVMSVCDLPLPNETFTAALDAKIAAAAHELLALSGGF
jgi:hypothetical protein